MLHGYLCKIFIFKYCYGTCCDTLFEVFKYLTIGFFFQDDPSDEVEPQVHEDLDLWEIVHAYIFGESEDENKEKDSKSDNAAERDSNGHTYKATKRKLMSVQDSGHEHNHYDSSHHHGKPHTHYSNPNQVASKSKSKSQEPQSQGMHSTVEDADQSDAEVEVEEEDDLETDSEESLGFSALFWDFIAKIADAWAA